MNVPNFINMKMIQTEGEEAGKLTPEAHNMFSTLFRMLQLTVSNEGLNVPQQTTTNISSLDGNVNDGNIIYDNDTHALKAHINGVYKTITVT